jgi:hypothetical protein
VSTVGHRPERRGLDLDRARACDEVDDSDHLGLGPVAAGSSFGGLDQRIGAFEKPVAELAVLPGDDPVPVESTSRTKVPEMQDQVGLLTTVLDQSNADNEGENREVGKLRHPHTPGVGVV